MTNKQEKYINYIEQKLKEKLKCELIDEHNCFILEDESIARVAIFGPDSTICLEYADNREMALKGIFPDDGDGFDMDDYTMEFIAEQLVLEAMGLI